MGHDLIAVGLVDGSHQIEIDTAAIRLAETGPAIAIDVNIGCASVGDRTQRAKQQTTDAQHGQHYPRRGEESINHLIYTMPLIAAGGENIPHLHFATGSRVIYGRIVMIE